jgi:hypothetical protein
MNSGLLVRLGDHDNDVPLPSVVVQRGQHREALAYGVSKQKFSAGALHSAPSCITRSAIFQSLPKQAKRRSSLAAAIMSSELK